MTLLDIFLLFTTLALLIFGQIYGNYLAQISVFLVFNTISLVLNLCGNLFYIFIHSNRNHDKKLGS